MRYNEAMEYREHIDRALAYIEENLRYELTPADAARAAGYSEYHFLRVFRAVTGMTPADYIRKRRLTEIVREMSRRSEPISAIAYEYGFNSAENFIRAFRREHGIAPTAYRAAASSLRLQERIRFRQEEAVPRVHLVRLEPFRLIAYKSDMPRPPMFWNRYNAGGWSKRLSGGSIAEDYGVSDWIAAERRLDYYIGIREEAAHGDRTDTVTLEIPGGLYAVFETAPTDTFDFVHTIHRTWDYIRETWLPSSGCERTGGYEFECYIEESRRYSEKIYIPVRKKERGSMKKLCVNFDGVTDTTGYLFSFAKCLAASLRCGGYADAADDCIAASGFAFRMWVDGGGLCPSATSIWEFKKQKPWVENAGFACDYIERLWGQDAVEAERREAAVKLVKASVDNGFAPVAWDVSGCEWGSIIGWDDETAAFTVLKLSGAEGSVPYEKLGQLDIPILSVLTVTGRTEKSPEALVRDTKKLAAAHLRGKEWCDNAKGLAAYDALLAFVGDKLTADTAWNLEYMLGTYAALKWYAWRFFEKYGEAELAALYKTVHESWQAAFVHRADKAAVLAALEAAKAAETRAAEFME